MTTTTRQPKALTESELFYDSPASATDLWSKGFRPIHAEDIKPGDTVAYYETDVFGLETVGDARTARVIGVKNEGRGEVEVDHRGGVTWAAEWSECWVKAAGK